MTFGQLATAIMKQADRLEKENARLGEENKALKKRIDDCEQDYIDACNACSKFEATEVELRAEIKRLRDEAEQMRAYLPYSHPLRVSPAPVTEGAKRVRNPEMRECADASCKQGLFVKYYMKGGVRMFDANQAVNHGWGIEFEEIPGIVLKRRDGKGKASMVLGTSIECGVYAIHWKSGGWLAIDHAVEQYTILSIAHVTSPINEDQE